MPILQSDLRNAAAQFNTARRYSSLNEAIAAKAQTAFLCHSHKDEVLARGLQAHLLQFGWSVYIDWQDTSMPETPNRETASKIQKKIRDCDWFFFLATANSRASRWCPWELGYTDGKKPLDSILIIPTRDDLNTNYGNEYLDLYRRLEVTTNNRIAAFQPSMTTNGILVESLSRVTI